MDVERWGAAVTETTDGQEVASLLNVLAAVSDPVRLEMVRRMAEIAAPAACGSLYDSIGKSTASHHFKLLREAGVIESSTVNGKTHQRLRYDEVEASYPGVLRSIIESAG
jgi:DNA-binding transcriptional ArsR family regulator